MHHNWIVDNILSIVLIHNRTIAFTLDPQPDKPMTFPISSTTMTITDLKVKYTFIVSLVTMIVAKLSKGSSTGFPVEPREED